VIALNVISSLHVTAVNSLFCGSLFIYHNLRLKLNVFLNHTELNIFIQFKLNINNSLYDVMRASI